MSKFTLVFVFMFLFFCQAEISRHPWNTSGVEKVIAEKLPSGWESFADHSCIVIRKKDDVILYNTRGLTALPSTQGGYLKRGKAERYVITLDFREKISQDEYKQLVKLKKNYVSLGSFLEVDLIDKNDNTKKIEPSVLKKILLPTYFFKNYSVYVHRTDKKSSVIDKEVRKEIEVVFKLIEKYLSKYTPAQ